MPRAYENGHPKVAVIIATVRLPWRVAQSMIALETSSLICSLPYVAV